MNHVKQTNKYLNIIYFQFSKLQCNLVLLSLQLQQCVQMCTVVHKPEAEDDICTSE